MPRTGRGGKRTLPAGQAAAQRTDLNTRRVLPATSAPNLPYGEAGQLTTAQQSVPMASAPSSSSAAVPSAGAGPGTSPAGVPVPGQAGPFNRPTEQPDVPVTAGAPFGPGPNSVPLPTTPPPLLAGVALLNTLGDAAPEQVKLIRQQAQLRLLQQSVQ